jgi:hypothetical protein
VSCPPPARAHLFVNERLPAALHGQIVLGIDTHKHTHVGVILDGLGRVSGALQFPATEAGTQRLLAWNQKNGGALIAGVEGTGSSGYQLTRALQLVGVTVLEVNRPDRANRRRRGKSDTVDAEAAARAVLSGQANAVPKDRKGAVDALRALTMARSSAVKATTQASNQIKALLVGCPEQLRQQLTVKSLLQLATRCAELDPCSGIHTALRSLGRRWLLLHAEIVELDTQIRALVRTTVPTLIAGRESGSTAPLSCSSPPVAIPPGYTATPPSRPSVGPARSRPAADSDSVTASTAAATEPRTTRSGSSRTTASSTTPRPESSPRNAVLRATAATRFCGS